MVLMIRLEEYREKVDSKYVGLQPDTRSIKPVHIANGLFRGLLGKVSDTARLNRFVVERKADGTVPRGHAMAEIMTWLPSLIEATPDETSLSALRSLYREVVDADSGVFLHKDDMESYSAGFEAFVSADRIGQSAGEFIAVWLESIRSPLADVIVSALADVADPVSALCAPWFGATSTYVVPFSINDSPALAQRALQSHSFEGARAAADTLAMHLESHPNKLSRLRRATLFASLIVIRHLFNLESYYVSNIAQPPMLLAFCEADEIRSASLMSFTHCTAGMTRFYAWALGGELEQRFDSVDQIALDGPPVYKGKQPVPDEVKDLWEGALAEADVNPPNFQVLGQALYDIMALQAEADPIFYVRRLGHRTGVLWPPDNFRPAKYFVFHPDVLDVVVRSCVGPGESVGLQELQTRMWNRWGMVVGGRSDDIRILLNSGIYQADTTALAENRNAFASKLVDLEFATLLADGVLKVKVEQESV